MSPETEADLIATIQQMKASIALCNQLAARVDAYISADRYAITRRQVIAVLRELNTPAPVLDESVE